MSNVLNSKNREHIQVVGVLNLLSVIAHNTVMRLIGLQIFSCYSKDEIFKLPHRKQTPGGGHGWQSSPVRSQTVQLKNTFEDIFDKPIYL